MFLFAVWGRKKTEDRLGFAADFCSVCRKISTFAVLQEGIAAHLYFIPVGKVSVTGHIQRCLVCRTVFGSNPNRFVRLLKKDAPSVDHLAHATFPTIYQEFAERLALEEQVATNPHGLEAGARTKLLLESFELASWFFDNRHSETGVEILITMLRPLAPSDGEVRECLQHFRQRHTRLGGRLSTEKIMEKLHWKPSPLDYHY